MCTLFGSQLAAILLQENVSLDSIESRLLVGHCAYRCALTFYIQKMCMIFTNYGVAFHLYNLVFVCVVIVQFDVILYYQWC